MNKNLLLFFVFYNSVCFSQLPFAELIKCFESDSIITIKDLESKEKFRIESKEKFGNDLDIYKFVYPIKSSIKKSLFLENFFFFELKKNCKFFKDLKTKFSFLSDNNKSKKSLKHVKSIHYTIITRKRETNEVNLTFIVRMRNEHFAKTFYHAIINPNVFRKNLFAIRKNNLVIIFYSSYFHTLSSEISSCFANSLHADEYFNYLI